jgi:hypothetical protein
MCNHDISFFKPAQPAPYRGNITRVGCGRKTPQTNLTSPHQDAGFFIAKSNKQTINTSV